MPGYERAELTAELKVLPSGENGRQQVEAAKTAAASPPSTSALRLRRLRLIDDAHGEQFRILGLPGFEEQVPPDEPGDAAFDGFGHAVAVGIEDIEDILEDLDQALS